MPAQSFNAFCPDWATALLNGFSQIFLQRHPLCGLLCLLAILVGAPAQLGGALLGALAGLLTAQRRGYAKADRQAGLFSYNGVLLGLLLSLYLPWSVLLPPLIIAAAGLSAILTQQWLKRARQPQSLPAYTAPFVGLGWLLLSLMPPQAALPLATPDLSPGSLLGGLLQGLGQIMFLGQPLAGLLILLGLLLANRRAAAWALIGSACGLALALMQQQQAQALSGLGGYNCALVALALGQQARAPWRPLAGMILALLITPGIVTLGLAPLTAPFVIACWLVHAAARVLDRTPRDNTPCAPPSSPPRLR
ncbi:urea transporter [Pseudomonas protegens]|uniref:Urea transporter n=1 Tax=Pseudomonas protegens TaxID=380021 RepID=A0A7G8YSX4_9PSED|nr:urea transporter [Pseudomonas protegens]QNH78772.1 urea transporter [Pseudomonas protegens]QNL07968.1 urea transporter [Pseudomonas protegens]